jgi:hypothetical protein
MLGQPSLKYRMWRLLSALLAILSFRFKTTRQLYGSVMPQYSGSNFFYQALDSAQVAVNTIVAFILAMIATIIGVNLIGPVATAVGGALKNNNLTGAANSLTAQITLLFVVVVILGVVIFIAVLGKMASMESA